MASNTCSAVPLDGAFSPCLKHGYVGTLVCISVCRKVNFVRVGVQNKRPFIDANFLDKGHPLFMFCACDASQCSL